ncbi:hypothetical protein BD310DRAFT_1023581, partial [Dichomitus squalens]
MLIVMWRSLLSLTVNYSRNTLQAHCSPRGGSRSCGNSLISSRSQGLLDESSTRYTHLTRTTSRRTNRLSCSSPSRRLT